MLERLLQIEHEPLPPINPGEIIRKTPNFRVVTDYKPGLENTRAGERFFLEPLTIRGIRMLFLASKAHNIYNFNHRPVKEYTLPCLRADYILPNVAVLLQGEVQVPRPGEDTIPSPDRMETCIAKEKYTYTFADDLPENFGILNPNTRDLKILQTTNKDNIPRKTIHSTDLDKYYKVRKGWWTGVLASVEIGLIDREFTDPQIIKELKTFQIKHTANNSSDENNLTISEKIQEANALIDKIWETYGKGKT
jgi:hypothetical protein